MGFYTFIILIIHKLILLYLNLIVFFILNHDIENKEIKITTGLKKRFLPLSFQDLSIVYRILFN